MTCTHGLDPKLCKDCLIESRAESKFKRVPIKKLKARSRSQELRVAKDYREVGFHLSRKVPMSGSLADHKGDVDPGELLLVECKETREGNLTITTDWLAKIQKEAFDKGRRWYGLHAWVAKDSGHFNKVVVVDEDLWFEVLTAYKKREKANK